MSQELPPRPASAEPDLAPGRTITAHVAQTPFEEPSRPPSPPGATIEQLFARRPVGPPGAVRRARSADRASPEAGSSRPPPARRLSLGDPRPSGPGAEAALPPLPVPAAPATGTGDLAAPATGTGDHAAQATSPTSSASSASLTEQAPAGPPHNDRALILHPSRRHPELWQVPASPTAPSLHPLGTDETGAEVEAQHAVVEEPEHAVAMEVRDDSRPVSPANVPLPEATASEHDELEHDELEHDVPEHDAPEHAAPEHDAPEHAAPEHAAPEQAMSRQRAEYYKAWSYMGQGIGAAMAIAGWGVLLGLPMEARVALLIAQLGLNIASTSKNALGSADDRHKGKQVTGDSEADVDKRVGSRRKARGQAISAAGGALTIVANAVPSRFPAPIPPLRTINGVAALINAYGQIDTGRGELRLGNPAKATGYFLAGAANVTGASGQFTEAGSGSKAAFPHAEGAGTLNSAMTPPGGAIDDARGAKKPWPYVSDPKVVGQVLAFIGQGLSSSALWMFNAHRVSSSRQNNQGQAQPDTSYLQTIAIIGLLGASILALGSGVSAYAEWPKTKVPGQDVEMATRTGGDHDAAPPGDSPPPAGQPAT